jgi:hypothetical protein
MRRASAVVCTIAFAFLASGCGEDDDLVPTRETELPADRPLRLPPVSEGNDPRFATVTSKGRELKIVPSDRPPPKRLLLREIKIGSGPVVRPGDRVVVFYIGVDYDTGKKVIETWPPEPALTTEIRHDKPVAWEESIVGMRAGGRREVLIPARRALGTGALDYVFDLVRVEPGSTGRNDD